jgi:hypothetical protein
MGCGASSGDNRVLPEPLASGTERDEFERLLKEPVDTGNPHGWQIKKPWPATYRDDFKMRVCLRKHESGNPNMLLRADGKFKGVVPQDFLDFLLKPENLPGFAGVQGSGDAPGRRHHVHARQGAWHEGARPCVEVHDRQAG